MLVEEDLRMSGQLEVTRRRLFQLGGAGAAALAADDRRLREAAAKLEYLTPLERAYILDKGKAGVAGLPPDKLREAGLVPETWRLEVAADPAGGSTVEHPFTLDWKGLMTLAEKHVVRFMHVGVCTNGADPYHMCLWEGVPLREVVWPAGPKANVRRVYYESYHQEHLAPFRASLALSQILENPPGQLPAILAFKMNGRPIPPSHGGPVRVIVPGGYGSKSIKWVQRVVLTNDYRANDSDAADWNNDTESPLKTRARFINPPSEAAAGQPVALTGMAQVGISGLAKVEYAVCSPGSAENWKEAAILPPPSRWGGGLPGGRLPAVTSQTDRAGKPLEWPLPYAIVHWAALLPGLPAGRYELCCRTIDRNGIAQPMPRPLPRTGVTAIHRVALVVRG
jgi:DMSO/TMAO reductase YedYZ molybdopterin-dependent catalytic subunit